MLGVKKSMSDLSNEIVGRIIGFLDIMDGRRANRVNRDWHSIYSQPYEQKKRVEKYFPARELVINDTDFESVFREESIKLLKKVFGIIQEEQDDEQLKTLNTAQILPYVAAALAGEVSHVESLGKAENDFLYMLAASHGHVDLTQLDEKRMEWVICIAVAYGCAKTVEAITKIEGIYAAEPALVQAATYGHLDLVQLLLVQLGDAPFETRVRALLKAIEKSHLCVVEYLYPQVEEVMSVEYKRVLLDSAVKNGCHSVVVYLYPQVMNVLSSEDKGEVFLLAAQYGHRSIVEYLYMQMVDVISFENKTIALSSATKNGHLSVMEYLYLQLANVIPTNYKGILLGVAALNGHLCIVKYLYPQVVDVISSKLKAGVLTVAAQNGHTSVVVYVYQQVADVISLEDKQEALIGAARNGHLGVVEYLYPQMVDVISSEDKAKALKLGVQNGYNYSIVTYFYQQVRDVLSSEDKAEALILAAQAGDLQIVKYFLEQHGNDFSMNVIQEILGFTKGTNNTALINYLTVTLNERNSLELTGALNSVGITPQFDNSRKQDQNNQSAPTYEAASSAGWEKKAPRG